MSNSQPFATPRSPLDGLRWLLVLPAAVVAGWLGRRLVVLFWFLRSDAYPEFLFPLLYLLPSGLAFTIAGALVAPRYRVAVAIVLAVLCVVQSLGIHILLQSKTGPTNYLHFAGESLGALLGVVLVATIVRRSELQAKS